MFSPYLYLAVITSGASILAIEILGTRIIGPFYGVSLYLWSALIGVTLAALAVGYALGGRWADRGPRQERLASLLGLAGIWMAIVPWLRHPVLGAAESLGLRAGVLVAAVALFFPPLMLLGMVSPYAIRLKAARLEEVGRTAGNLFAVSTIASVLAAIATGFWLIPNLGVGWLTFAIGILLVAVGTLGLALRRHTGATMAAVLVLAFATAGGIWAAPGTGADPARGILALKDSPYAELRVLDRDDLTYLLVDGTLHSAADPVTLESPFGYVNVLEVPKGMYEKPGDLLLVGLGGGSLAVSYARSDWHVDAVEIDPDIPPLARRFFGLRPHHADVHVADGRRFLAESDHTWDLIILDAFGSSSIPFHLVTEEAFALAKRRLAPDGIIALNIWAIGWDDIIVRSLAATLGTQFEHVLALPMAEPPDQLDNLILLASDRPLELRQEPPVPEDRFSAEYNRAHAWDNRFEPRTAGAPIVTDDRNPVDVWSERIGLVARRQMHEVYSREWMGW